METKFTHFDEQGNAVSLSQNYQVATDEATFDEFYKSDNGDNPIYNKETLDHWLEVHGLA